MTGAGSLFVTEMSVRRSGALIIFAGIIGNLHIYFAPTSLFDTLVMLGLLAGGIGVIARSLRAQP